MPPPPRPRARSEQTLPLPASRRRHRIANTKAQKQNKCNPAADPGRAPSRALPPQPQPQSHPSRSGAAAAAARCQVTAEKRFTGLEVRNARLVFRSDPHSYICKAKGGREINGLGVPGGRAPSQATAVWRAGWRTRRPGAPRRLTAAVRNKPPPPRPATPPAAAGGAD